MLAGTDQGEWPPPVADERARSDSPTRRKMFFRFLCSGHLAEHTMPQHFIIHPRFLPFVFLQQEINELSGVEEDGADGRGSISTIGKKRGNISRVPRK